MTIVQPVSCNSANESNSISYSKSSRIRETSASPLQQVQTFLNLSNLISFVSKHTSLFPDASDSYLVISEKATAQKYQLC